MRSEPPGRCFVEAYLPESKRNTVYRYQNLFASQRSKAIELEPLKCKYLILLCILNEIGWRSGLGTRMNRYHFQVFCPSLVYRLKFLLECWVEKRIRYVPTSPSGFVWDPVSIFPRGFMRMKSRNKSTTYKSCLMLQISREECNPSWGIQDIPNWLEGSVWVSWMSLDVCTLTEVWVPSRRISY